MGCEGRTEWSVPHHSDNADLWENKEKGKSMPTPSFIRSGDSLLNILGGRSVNLGTNCIRLYCTVLCWTALWSARISVPQPSSWAFLDLTWSLVAQTLFLTLNPLVDISVIVHTDMHLCTFSQDCAINVAVSGHLFQPFEHHKDISSRTTRLYLTKLRKLTQQYYLMYPSTLLCPRSWSSIR